MAKREQFHYYPFWSPRFWHGMLLGDWLKLLATHLTRIHIARWPMAIAVTLVTPTNSICRLIQSVVYGKRIEAAKIEQPPVFILGHWRSGTTYLHELMILDDRLTYPTTFQCCAPYQTLVSEPLITRYLKFLVPSKRPMDNMKSGWERPQEDEFALLALGLPTPYRRLGFPNDPPPDMEWLNLRKVDSGKLQKWSDKLKWFVKLLTFRDNKRVVLKSPPHTGRIEHLSKLFPGARFVHLVRNPYDIFPSTRRLWQALDSAQGFQLPKNQHLDEYVFTAFEQMYDGFHEQREEIPAQQLIDIKYEELVRDPVETLRRIYEQLDLGDFSEVETRIVENRRETKDYKTNTHQLEDETRSTIAERWSDYFERYGYEK